jgi:hypothetical protein
MDGAARGEAFNVVAYCGYRAEQEPRALVFEGRRTEVREVEDRWLDPRSSYFKVRCTNGSAYLVRYDFEAREWSLVRTLELAN